MKGPEDLPNSPKTEQMTKRLMDSLPRSPKGSKGPENPKALMGQRTAQRFPFWRRAVCPSHCSGVGNPHQWDEAASTLLDCHPAKVTAGATIPLRTRSLKSSTHPHQPVVAFEGPLRLLWPLRGFESPLEGHEGSLGAFQGTWGTSHARLLSSPLRLLPMLLFLALRLTGSL